MDDKDRIVDEAHKLKDDVDQTVNLSWDFLKTFIIFAIVVVLLVLLIPESW